MRGFLLLLLSHCCFLNLLNDFNNFGRIFFSLPTIINPSADQIKHHQ